MERTKRILHRHVFFGSLHEEEVLAQKVLATLELIFSCGGIDGEHHKTWIIDQVVRILTAGVYDDWVKEYCAGENGPNTYSWDEGIAP